MGARIIGGVEGDNLLTIILASSVLYELVGPGLSKLGLYLSKSYTTNIDEIVSDEIVVAGNEAAVLTPVEILTRKINKIREEMPEPEMSEEEKAFTDAAEEYFDDEEIRANRRFINRR